MDREQRFAGQLERVAGAQRAAVDLDLATRDMRVGEARRVERKFGGFVTVEQPGV